MALAGFLAWQLWGVARNPEGDRESRETQQREINALLRAIRLPQATPDS